MSASVITRSCVLTALLAATFVLPAAAQPRPEAPPRLEAQPKTKLGPSVRDGGGLWADAVRQKIEEAVRDLYADYRCYVLIETYDGVPAQAGEVDLSDPGAVDKALNARRNELTAKADRSNTVLSLVYVQSKRCRRCSFTMSWPAFGKEEGEHIYHEVLHRVNTRGVADALSYLRVAVAGKPTAGSEADGTHVVGGSAFHDGVGWWASADQEKLRQLVSDIMRRYKCKIYIETRPTLPARLARGQDLTDHVIANRLFGEWVNSRSAEVNSKDGLNINIFGCSEVHMFAVRVSWPTPGRTWTKEEQALANKLNVGMNQRLAGKFAPGMADALDFVRDTLEENRALMARAPASSMAPVSSEPHPSPETPPPSDNATKTFRAAAEAGGLSAADLNAVLAARASVSYETLTEFINDQVKEGRKGKDLKDDVLTFLKFLQEKK